MTFNLIKKMSQVLALKMIEEIQKLIFKLVLSVMEKQIT